MGNITHAIKYFSHRRDLPIAIGLLLFSSFVALGILEFGLRIRNALNATYLGPNIEADARRGWRTRPNYHFSGKIQDCKGAYHEISIITDVDGFRIRMPETAGHPRIFFLGDSFTFARDASQESVYYHIAGELLEGSVAAYGTEGYNTLQEYLALDEYIAQVQPDIVVLQVCSNDFIGNSIALTQQSSINQCQVVQPYLGNGNDIIYQNPGERFFSKLVAPFHLQTLRAIALRLDNWNGVADVERHIETVIAEEGPNHPLFRESVEITRRIFDMLKARCGHIPLLVFNVDEQEPYHSAFAGICKELNIPYLHTIPAHITAAASSDVSLFASDCAHWSNSGQVLCGKALAEAIQHLDILPKSSRFCVQ